MGKRIERALLIGTIAWLALVTYNQKVTVNTVRSQDSVIRYLLDKELHRPVHPKAYPPTHKPYNKPPALLEPEVVVPEVTLVPQIEKRPCYYMHPENCLEVI